MKGGETMGLMDGRRGLIFGVANERSIAWAVAQGLMAQGATCGFTHLPGEKMERRVRKTLEKGGLPDAWLQPCDVSRDEDLDACFEAARNRFDTIDFLVHSLAFANHEYLKLGNFHTTPRDAFAQALDISAYSLVAMAHRVQPLMTSGGSIIAMTYLGSEKVVPAYNVMGVAKAALEACARYLAAEMGQYRIRVNTISAGPLRTLSSMAVGGIDDIFPWVERKAPLRRNIEPEDVARTAVYLLSDLSSGVTGENVFVDSGYSIMGL